MEYFMTFIFIFLIILIIYYLYYVMFSRRDRRKPIEATYLIKLYNLDIDKFSYRKFLSRVAIMTSLDVAIVTMIVSIFDELVWQILFGIISILPVIAISFTLIGKYYQRKQLKDNSKELLKEKKSLARMAKFESKILNSDGKFRLFKKKKKGKK